MFKTQKFKHNAKKLCVKRECIVFCKNYLKNQSNHNYLRRCKKHFQNHVLIILRKEVRNLYRGPEKAYSAMDFSGSGVISEAGFLSSLIV